MCVWEGGLQWVEKHPGEGRILAKSDGGGDTWSMLRMGREQRWEILVNWLRRVLATLQQLTDGHGSPQTGPLRREFRSPRVEVGQAENLWRMESKRISETNSPELPQAPALKLVCLRTHFFIHTCIFNWIKATARSHGRPGTPVSLCICPLEMRPICETDSGEMHLGATGHLSGETRSRKNSMD